MVELLEKERKGTLTATEEGKLAKLKPFRVHYPAAQRESRLFVLLGCRTSILFSNVRTHRRAMGGVG